MATGPEHYRKAEQLAAMVEKASDSADATTLAILAQTHATLALTAVNALTGNGGHYYGEGNNLVEWQKTAGPVKSTSYEDDVED